MSGGDCPRESREARQAAGTMDGGGAQRDEVAGAGAMGTRRVQRERVRPAAVRGLSRTPEEMAVLAAVVGALSVIGGLFASLQWDTPSGPSIVVVATVLFALGLGVGAVRRGAAA